MELTAEQMLEQKYFNEYFQKKSTFQDVFKNDTYEIDIQIYALKFREMVINHLKKINIMDNTKNDLENLHNFCHGQNFHYDEHDINPIQKSLYSLTEENRNLYYEFIAKCLRSFFPFDFFFQREITFRVHMPQSSNSKNYKSPFPKFHMDSCLGHPPNEINIWIPLTKLNPKEAHSFNLSTVNDSKKLLEKFDYLPKSIDSYRQTKGKELDAQLNHYRVMTDFGKALIFDARIMHSAMPVLFHTRVSIDIRILPVNDYYQLPYEFKGTGRMQTSWKPGYGYDSLISSKV